MHGRKFMMKKNKNKYTFGLGTVGRDMLYTMISMYLMFYLTDVLCLPRTADYDYGTVHHILYYRQDAP